MALNLKIAMKYKIFNALNKIITFITFLMIVGIFLAFLFASFKSYSPIFDSFVHIRVLLLWLLIIPVFIFIILPNRRKLLLIVFVCFVFGLANIYLDNKKLVIVRNADFSKQNSFSLMQINLRFDNPNHDLLLQRVKETQPDFITYQEASATWQETLKTLEATYPYRFECNRPFGPVGGSGILSRFPFEQKHPIQYCIFDSAITVATFSIMDKPILIRSIHLPWPWPFQQNSVIQEFERLMAENFESADNTGLIDRQIIAGDFNAVSTSHAVWRIAKATHTNILAPTGSSWSSYSTPHWLKAALSLPIDQVLISDHVNAYEFKLLETIGSDHLPLLVQFGFDN